MNRRIHSPIPLMIPALRGGLLVLQGTFGLGTAYLLLLLGAATRRSRQCPPAEGGQLRFLILIPAYDEAVGIGVTLASINAIDYPADRREIVVIADNCTDDTAEIARAAGAQVLERTDPTARGKGHAIAWALEYLLPRRPTIDAVVILDADCTVTRNLLSALETPLLAGAAAVQADYVVSNPTESWAAGLRFAAFRLINTVRPLGKDRLGLSCGLLGTGMAFSRAVLERHPWVAYSLIEDGEYHLQLVAAGERVAFVPEAVVSSPMPISLRAARNQQLRHEGGKWPLIRAWTPLLVRSGLAAGDPVRLHAGLEPLIPPQSLLFAGNVVFAGLALTWGNQVSRTLAAVNLLGQAAYVLGGLRLVGAPAAVYRALLLAPALVAWKVGLYVRIVTGRGPRTWVRTDRGAGTDAIAPAWGES
jgi:hypothetical protein